MVVVVVVVGYVADPGAKKEDAYPRYSNFEMDGVYRQDTNRSIRHARRLVDSCTR